MRDRSDWGLCVTELYQNEEDLGATPEAQSKFYKMIGLCVTRYQQIEDRLQPIFQASLEHSEEASSMIFGVARGLESQLALVSAAVIDRDAIFAELWGDLRPRIKGAADNRNQIAHSTTLLKGRGIVIGDDGFLGYNEPASQFQLEKSTKSGKIYWNTERLLEEYEALDELSRHLTVFFRLLVDGAIPANFRDWWAHPNLKEYLK